jgi:hypothetical protein
MSTEEQEFTLDKYFEDNPDSRQLFDALHDRVLAVGPAEIRVTRSQVAFWRRKAFAWAWMPAIYLRRKAAPLVLTIALRRRDDSPRWKQVVESSPGRFTHHLELYSRDDLDDEIHTWLQEAWELAG